MWNDKEQHAINIAMENMATYGTDRVVTSNRGTTVPFEYALKDFNIEVEVVFLRNDGWTLGCHRRDIGTAWDMHHDTWIAVMIRPESEFRHISEVHRNGNSLFRGILPKSSKFMRYPKRSRRPSPGGIKGLWHYVGKATDEQVKKEKEKEETDIPEL